jgi:hyperosmotically inducible periplasmic protein
MKAMTQSALAVVSALAVATSLAACNQSTPGKDSMSSSRSTPSASSTADTSSTMTPAPAPSAATDSSQKVAAADTSPKGTPGNDDAALTAQVKTALQSEPALRAQSIDVDTKNATVTLTGAVDSAASKAKANEVAASVNGVSAVVDHLTIKAS